MLLSEPFEPRLLLSLKNDKNILSHSLLCHDLFIFLYIYDWISKVLLCQTEEGSYLFSIRNKAAAQKWHDLLCVTQALHTQQHSKTVIRGLVFILNAIHKLN